MKFKKPGTGKLSFFLIVSFFKIFFISVSKSFIDKIAEVAKADKEEYSIKNTENSKIEHIHITSILQQFRKLIFLRFLV